ncbi:MAG: AAA family ATPase, partial [Bacilli bacterium]|nr:AAA family ATPase [Bacilli bacterium]
NMKLLSCHIANYGKYSGVDFDFNSGLTSFNLENGAGKSTLASFIVAMFYGLPSYTRRTKFNERLHYFPFNKQKFGGNITFEHKGSIYIIERYFGEKSETDDTFKIFKDHVPYAIQDGVVAGKYFFEIDEEAFKRTLFIEPKDIGVFDDNPSDIGNKLNNFVDEATSAIKFDDVIDRLTEYKKTYKATGKHPGRVTVLKDEVARLKELVANGESIESSIGEKYARFEEMNATLKEKDALLADISSYQVQLEQWSQYDGLKEREGNAVRDFKEKAASFPNGYPNEDEFSALKKAVLDKTANEALLANNPFTMDDENKLASLSKMFGDGVPSNEDIASIQEKIKSCEKDEASILAMKKEDSPREKELKNRFDDSKFDEQDLISLKSKVCEYVKLEEEMKDIPDHVIVTQSTQIPSSSTKKNPTFLIILIVAAVLIAAGIGLLFASPIFGGVVAGMGAVALFVDAFLYLKNKAELASLKPAESVSVDNPEKIKAKNILIDKKGEIISVVAPLGYKIELGVASVAVSLEKDFDEYKRTKASKVKIASDIKALSDGIQTKKAEIASFFVAYGIEKSDYHVAIDELKHDLYEYSKLKSSKEDSMRKREAYSEHYKFSTSTIDNILKKYKLIASGDEKTYVDDLHARVLELKVAESNMEARMKEAESFKEEHNLSERPIFQDVDCESLSGEVDELKKQIAFLDTEIRNDEDGIDALNTRRFELENAQEELDECLARTSIIEKTISFLEDSEASLIERYVGPIKDKFFFYSDAIESTFSDVIHIDKNLNVTYDCEGEVRDQQHLSDGQRSVVVLCLRMALIDNMYEDNAPFIILDDPFVNLDEKHMEGAKKLIAKLSQRRQIIYFSCHPSREI